MRMVIVKGVSRNPLSDKPLRLYHCANRDISPVRRQFIGGNIQFGDFHLSISGRRHVKRLDEQTQSHLLKFVVHFTKITAGIFNFEMASKIKK